jgi:hypothetical protein
MSGPRVIHRYWGGPVRPPYVDQFDATLRDLHPGWEVVTWTPETLPGSVNRILARTAGGAFAHETERHRSNVIRYWLLDTIGGIWADCDIKALRPFDPLLARTPFFASLGSSIEGGLIGAAPGHPVFAALLAECRSSDRRQSSVSLSGAGLLGRVVPRFDDVQLLEARAVFQCDAAGRPVVEHEPAGGPYAEHLWASSRLASARAAGHAIELRASSTHGSPVAP